MSATLLSARTPRTADVRIRAAAKINLTLRMLGRRSDGFHDLQSLVMGVDLCDALRIERTGRSGVEFRCNHSALVTQDNLAVRAARRLAERIGFEPDLRIDLEKCIPIGAGLGGGSADAAAALRACNELWSAGLTNDELAEIGAEIGSDVPLFFSLPSCMIEGRGGRVSKRSMRWSGFALIVFPGYAISTAEVYAAWRNTDGPTHSAGWLEDALQADSAEALTSCLFNDLEPALFRVCPAMADLIELVENLGSQHLGSFRVTGSGSAVYRLFDDEEAAIDAAKRIRDRMPEISAHVAAAPVGWQGVLREES